MIRVLFIFLLLTSCRMFRSDEQNAIKDIEKYERKLNRIYAEFNKFYNLKEGDEDYLC